jgi:hypothetical protein
MPENITPEFRLSPDAKDLMQQPMLHRPLTYFACRNSQAFGGSGQSWGQGLNIR